MGKIIVIGDSHASLYSDISTRNRGVWMDKSLNNKFDVRWLGPFTYWKLCRDGNSFVDLDKDIFYGVAGPNVTTKCEVGSKILLVFGEIDVRCHILKFTDVTFQETVDNLIYGIKDFINKYKDRFELHIQSIVPTIYRKNFGNKVPLFPFVGNDEERRDVTLYFNEKLKEMCVELGIGYFDIFDIYSDDNNMLLLEKSDKIVHVMKTLELEKYIKEYFGF